MSSIIKGGRIINQSIIIDLEQRSKKNLGIEQQPEDSIQIELAQNYEKLKNEAEQEAKDIVESARKQAKEILEKAELEKEDIENEIVSIKETMLKDAKALSESIVEDAKGQEATILEGAYEEKKRIIETAEPEIIQMVTNLLEHIVGDTLFQNTDWVRALVRKVIDKETIIENATIVTSPTLYTKLTDEGKDSFDFIRGNVDFRQDHTLDENTCIIETAQGNIVYDVKQGLNTVLTELKILQTL